ncbi:MAG: hypothetical protein ABSE71_03775 [Candidatus Micrarchaeaceae archaeon]|jgi:hypothetical protein|nr:hypothetical protein [Candidatus Micrarchaeota archaeon]
MPRNTRRATPERSKSAWPNVLRFIASLLFLYVIFSGVWWSPWVTSGVGQIWLPILLGVAVLSAVGLFFGSLAGIASKMNGGGMIWKAVMLGSFALVALTVSPVFSAGFWVAILGFLLGWFGSAMEWMR